VSGNRKRQERDATKREEKRRWKEGKRKREKRRD
jgi:hypothetical protein